MKVIIPIIAIVFVLFLCIYWGGSVASHADTSDTHIEHTYKESLNIRTALPSQKKFTETVWWRGTVQSVNVVKISAQQDGLINKIYVADNAEVKTGDLLFQLGGKLIDNQLKHLASQSTLIEQKITLTKQILNNKRQAVKLHVLPVSELLQIEMELQNLRQQRKSIQLQIDAIQSRDNIRAPLDGIFTNRKVSEGQFVTTFTELADIVDSHHLRIVADTFTPDRLSNQRAEFVLDGLKLTGVVKSVLPDKSHEGAAIVYIESEDINRHCLNGETISGQIITEKHSSLAIPESAVIRDANEDASVFVKAPAGKYTKRGIKTGLSSGKMIEVISGIKPSDEVVTEGAYELFFSQFNKIYKVAD